jgi:transketolase
MALAQKLRKSSGRTVVLMGDGEQQKGQVAEARRFAVKYGLNNLFAVIDRNHLQIGGDTNRVMPQAIEADYVAAQWNSIYLKDGHDFEQIFHALHCISQQEVVDPANPTVIVARTVMGNGVSFMENKAKYHGSTLSEGEAAKALEELGLDNPIPFYRERRKTHFAFREKFCEARLPAVIRVGEPRSYDAQALTDNRSAYGVVLEDLARLNNRGEVPGVLGFSCDLEGSVKMDGFHKISEHAFFESGIQEHHAATLAGAISKEGFVTFFSTFGVFGVGETYNQQRLNDINQTHLKLVCTHVGLDVGEDGQTHQCIDYIGLLQNLYDFSIFMPADPNQTDRIIRYAAAHPGNFFIGMGRSKLRVICSEAGAPVFGGDYRFVPGRAEWVRQGCHGAILSYGTTLHHAIQAHEELLQRHNLKLAVLNFASIRPLDMEAINRAADLGLLVTVEDHHVDTGLGARVATVVSDQGRPCRLLRLGVKNYGLSGNPAELYRLEGIDASGIVRVVVKADADGWLRK